MDKNKLEKAVKGIKMPEETAKKIISKCREYEPSAAADEEYSQQVSGVEMAENRRIFRFSAAAAALALVAGGIALTAHLARRPQSDRNYLTAVEVEPTEIQQSTQSIDSSAATSENTISFFSFESLAQEGIPVRYTLSDKPMPDLTPEKCRLLDEYFNSAAEAYELVPAESRSSSSEPAMKFEAVRNGDISCYIYIYADDFVYIMHENGYSGLYRYKGTDGYMNSPLRTRIETTFRNGNITDDAAFYPPFGNFSKMSSEPYQVTVFDGEGVIHSGEVSGEVLHHAFYGYNWTECEDVMTKTEPSEINIIRIEFQTIDGYETVTVDNNGYVTWYINSSDTVRNYQLDDTRAFDMIIGNV